MVILADKRLLGQALPAKLSGPLLSKELRVAWRRRRNYALRFAYVIMLGKCAGILRRCGPIWLPLLAYVAVRAFRRRIL